MEQIVSLLNVTKKYQDVSALNNISFTLSQGDTLGYLGPNGSGKTTTLKAMLGLVRYQAGDIKLLGHDVKTEYNMLYGTGLPLRGILMGLPTISAVISVPAAR